MLTLTSCRYLLEKPLVELGFLAGLYFPGAPQAHSELLHLGRAKRIQFNSVRPCWLEFPAVNFSRGFLRIPMRGGGGLLPLLQSHMPLFNDLLGCELSGTDFAARTFGARRLPAAPKLCSTHSRNPTACERRASWEELPVLPEDESEDEEDEDDASGSIPNGLRRIPTFCTRTQHSTLAAAAGSACLTFMGTNSRSYIWQTVTREHPARHPLLAGPPPTHNHDENHTHCFLQPHISPRAPFQPFAHGRPPAPPQQQLLRRPSPSPKFFI